jgi:CO/xanthine dehydrogenase Mo-binding subunit
MSQTGSIGAVIGRSLPRLEDRTLLTGQGRFASDISFPDQLTMRIVRSPNAHGKILSIDASEARALPGVFAVWTAADVAELSPIDVRLTKVEGLAPYRQYVMARRLTPASSRRDCRAKCSRFARASATSTPPSNRPSTSSRWN